MNFNLDFKVLAYSAPNSNSELVSPCLCSLVFRCDDAPKQATILLVASFPTAHATETTVVLQYDADKLLSGTVSLSSGNGHIPQPQLDEILRDKGNKRQDVKTLNLSVEHPCPLWYPDTTPPYSPNPGYEPAFQQFADLAKSTTIHIVFDYKHLRKEQQGMFRAFGKAARGLVGYPVEASLVEQGLRKASWEVFGPVGAAGAPPAYDSSYSRKRPRRASSSSSIKPLKQSILQSPTKSHSSGKTIPFSPVAAAEALERALRRASPEYDFRADAINAAIERQLPAYFNKAQALQNETIEAAVARQIPAYIHGALQTEAIDAAVSKQLDTVLRALLPNALEDLLAPKSLPSSPATSFTSIDSRGNKYPKLPPLTAIGRIMIPHLRTHLTDEFQKHQANQLQRFEKLVDKTLDQLETSAYNDRAHAAADFEAEMEEHKAEVLLLKRDTIDDLWREIDDVFAQGREEGCALGDDINERLSELCDKIERIKRLRLRKMVRSELSRQTCRKKRIPKGVGKTLNRAHHALLGKRREAMDVEWVDC